MLYTLITISTFFLSSGIFGQNTRNRSNTPSWDDSTVVIVKLRDTVSDNRVVAVEVGKKAIIYMKLKPVMLDARKNLSNDFSKESYQEIIHYFDSASSQGDTIFISEYLNLQHLDYLVAHRLMDGNASVYYKKQNAFVSNISHRLERYGGHADRFLYLPDSRPFFTVTELTGILVKGEKLLNNGHLKAYVEEAQKLQSIRKE